MKHDEFHEFYNLAPIGYILTDPRGLIADINVAACAALGQAAEDLIGKPFEILVVEAGFSFAAFLDDHAIDCYVEKAPLELRCKDGGVIETLVNARVGRESVLLVFDDVTKRNRLARDRERLISELKEALDRIRTLTGILPICAGCKKIRTDRGEWQQIEVYIRERTDAEFSHGLCPACVKRLYPDY